MGYTADEIISALKVKAMVPVSQETIQDDDILGFINDELIGYILPLMLRVREEYYI
jgi:hypothetical protein